MFIEAASLAQASPPDPPPMTMRSYSKPWDGSAGGRGSPPPRPPKANMVVAAAGVGEKGGRTGEWVAGKEKGERKRAQYGENRQ